MSSRARPDPTHHFTHKKSHVEIHPNFYVFFLFVVRVSLNFAPQPYYYYNPMDKKVVVVEEDDAGGRG